MCQKSPERCKVGDTLTATVEPSDAVVTYSWTLNGVVVGATSTYTVPASATTGDIIAVTVTDKEGNTASDSAIVSGLTIEKVEPTTAARNGVGYKYVRIYFSEPLSSLDKSEVEIRGAKSNQLYSIESLTLSSSGLFADVILYGDYSGDGTTFLQANQPYVATINHDGMTDSLEFELPAVVADDVVIAVDEAENKIYTFSSGRSQAISDSYYRTVTTTDPVTGATTTTYVPVVPEYDLGVAYSGNIGELLGRTVSFGYNADRVITELSVDDEVVVIDSMKYVDADQDGTVSKKDYLVNNEGGKFYFEDSNTATKNETHVIAANNQSTTGFVAFAPNDGDQFDYARLVLNPSGTISTAVLNENNTDFLRVSEVNGSTVIADKQTSKNLEGYALFNGEALISTADLEVDDVVYYSTGDEFAYVYNEAVTGELDNVLDETLDLDGTTYTWTDSRYYDTPNKKYVTLEATPAAKSVASQKYLNSLDPDEVTLTLKMNGTIAYVDGTVVGETETTTTTYVITGASAQKTVSFDEIVRIPANDGSASTTLDFNPKDLKSVDGQAGKYDTAAPNTSFTFDPTKAGEPNITKTAATDYAYTELIEITTDNATGTIVGVKELGDLSAARAIAASKLKVTATSTTGNKIGPDTTKVTADGKTYALKASTKVWIVVNDDGTKAAAAAGNGTKAASVKVMNFSDYAMTTASVVAGNDIAAFVYPDNADAKHLVIVQAKDKDEDAWDQGELGYASGVVVKETFIAKGDGTDNLVVKTITIKDAEGTEIALDANGTVDDTVAPGDYVTLTYTKSDSKVSAITETDWTYGTISYPMAYSGSVLTLDNAQELRAYSNCLILEHTAVGLDDVWTETTISDINGDNHGWGVKYHSVSTAGTKDTVDFVIVDDISTAAGQYDAWRASGQNALATLTIPTPATITAADYTTATTDDANANNVKNDLATYIENAVVAALGTSYDPTEDMLQVTVTDWTCAPGAATIAPTDTATYGVKVVLNGAVKTSTSTTNTFTFTNLPTGPATILGGLTIVNPTTLAAAKYTTAHVGDANADKVKADLQDAVEDLVITALATDYDPTTDTLAVTIEDWTPSIASAGSIAATDTATYKVKVELNGASKTDTTTTSFTFTNLPA